MWKEDTFGIVKGVGIGILVAWLFYDRLCLLPFMFPLLFPWMRMERERKKRQRRQQMEKEFKEMALSIENSLSAGYSLENACVAWLDEVKEFSRGEEHVLATTMGPKLMELKVHEPIEQVLTQVAGEIDLEEFSRFAQVVMMVKKNGGNLIEILRKTVSHMNQALQLKEEIYTMTAAKRMEKNIMVAMPFFILAYVRLSNPDYFRVLYTSIAGVMLSTVVLVVLAVVQQWAERVVCIEL